jgi:hypothetical protein
MFQLKRYCKEKQWHFAGARPQNFPTIRIAQLSALLHQKPRMFSNMVSANSLDDIRILFSLEVSDYWKNHFTFNKKSKPSSKKLSTTFIDKLIINLVVPTLFFYGKYLGEEVYTEKAISFLEQTKPEKNRIIKGFAKLSVPCSNAFDSQALIELKNEHCDHKMCLSCRIGFALLK